MPTLKKTGSLLTMAALAASTTLSGPSFAYAEETARLRMAQAEDQPPVEEAAPAEEPAPVEEAAPAEEPAADEPAPAEEMPAEEAAPAGDNQTEPPGETQAPAEEPAPAEEVPAEEQAQPDETPAEAPPTEEAPPAEEAPQIDPAPPVEEAPPEELAPAEEAPAAPAPDTLQDAPDAPSEIAPEAPAVEAPAENTPTPEAPAEAPTLDAPAADQPSIDAPALDAQPEPPAPNAPAEVAPEAPVVPEVPLVPPSTAPTAPDALPAAPDAAPTAPDAVPIAPQTVPAAPDTVVEDPAAPPAAPDAAAADQPVISATPVAPLPAPAAETPQPVSAEIQNAPVDPSAISRSDARVQQLSQSVTVQSVRVEQGQRIEEAPRYALPPRTEVVERVGNRDIIAIAGAAAAGAAAGAAAAYFIRSDDDTRMRVDASERYSERLDRGRFRETIVRPNGVQVVSITNEYGDVIQRSRMMPDGREVVLFYDPYAEDEQRPDYFYDPGADLPPLRLNIPEDEYIVDIAEPDEEVYFNTIVAPPVETVERLYSVDEVRRSPRIREKVRRIDINTINFDFGSAAISQEEVGNLQALADAVARVIKANPGETFLIEGHTDAVGSNVANLALSDKRAEAVASALAEYFDIPPENLVTQGYGEEDLKVKTQSPSRENRRVTLRRITSLVKPVTSASAQ